MSRHPREPSRAERRRPHRLGVALFAAAIIVWSAGARAEEVPDVGSTPAGEDTAPITPPVALRARLVVDLPVTLGLGALAVGALAVHDDLAPEGCRVCDGSAPGASNGLDQAARDAFRRTDTTPARTTSHVLAFGAAPILALSLDALAAFTDRRKDEISVDALVIAQAAAAAAAVDQGLGLALARETPRAHAAARSEDGSGSAGPDGLGALPSSHVTLAFALAASSGTVASMRGYRLAPLVWGSGMAVGLATAYARIASDDAWLTDTLAGAGLGTAVGVLVPLLFHSHAPLARRLAIRGGRTVDVGISF